MEFQELESIRNNLVELYLEFALCGVRAKFGVSHYNSGSTPSTHTLPLTPSTGVQSLHLLDSISGSPGVVWGPRG